MAQQSIVGSNPGLETAPAATWRPSISLVYPMFNEEENIERAVHFAEAGFKITQFGVDYFPRNRGTSTLASPDVIIKMIQELVAFRMKMRREIRAFRVSAS